MSYVRFLKQVFPLERVWSCLGYGDGREWGVLLSEGMVLPEGKSVLEIYQGREGVRSLTSR